MKTDSFFLLCLTCFTWASITHAGPSHADWLAEGGHQSPLTVVMHPAEGPSVRGFRSIQVSDAMRLGDVPEADWEIPARPDGGWFGELEIGLPAQAALAFPLSIELSLASVQKEDLLPASTNQVRELFWDADMELVQDKAPLRYRPRIRTWKVAEQPEANHFVLPLVEASVQGSPGWGNPEMYSMLCEITDAKGTVLYRGRPVEVFADSSEGHPSVWNMGPREHSGRLDEPGGYEDIMNRGVLPPTWEVWNALDGLWVNEETAPLLSSEPARLRRLLLMGVWIHADAVQLNSLAKAVGITWPTRVLLGGLSDLSEGGWSAAATRKLYGNSRRSFWDDDPDLLSDESAYLANRHRLFAPLRPWFVTWTLVLLGLFLLTVLIALPTVFVLLKGRMRLQLWVWVPATCIAFAVVVCLGFFVLPRKTSVDVTEYRLGVSGWPECYVQSVGRALIWGERRIEWEGPPDSFRIWCGSEAGEYAARRTEMVFSKEENVWAQHRIVAGTLTKIETGAFREETPPIRIEQGVLYTSAPCSVVAVWYLGAWHVAGPMEAGQSVVLADLPTKPRLPGLPLRLRSILPQAHSCSSGSCAHQTPSTYDPYDGHMLVLAELKEGEPLLRPKDGAEDVHKTVIWLVQVQGDAEGGSHE